MARNMHNILIENYNKEVMNMEQADLDTISEIVAKYGFIEWTLIGFTPSREYNIFSYFTDASIMPIFKLVLISMLKTVNDHLGQQQYSFQEAVHASGRC